MRLSQQCVKLIVGTRRIYTDQPCSEQKLMMDVFQLSFSLLSQRFSRIFLLICVLAVSVTAQTSSTITGDVKDTNGAVLAGVKVTATNSDTGLTRTTTSEAEGRFVFPSMAVGLYELRAESAGFEPLTFPNVRLTVNDTTDVSLVMKVSTLSADVTINSGEALVNTQTPELSY